MSPIWSALLFVALAATTVVVGFIPPMHAWLGPFVGDGAHVNAAAINPAVRLTLRNEEIRPGFTGVHLHTIGVIGPYRYQYDPKCPGTVGINIDDAETFCGITKITILKDSPRSINMTLHFGNLCQLEVMISELKSTEKNDQHFIENYSFGEFDLRHFIFKEKKLEQPVFTELSWLDRLLRYGLLKSPGNQRPLYKTRNIRLPTGGVKKWLKFINILKNHVIDVNVWPICNVATNAA